MYGDETDVVSVFIGDGDYMGADIWQPDGPFEVRILFNEGEGYV